MSASSSPIPRHDYGGRHSFPKVVIFDLDHTFWPLDVDTDPILPFSKRGGNGARADEVIDAHGVSMALFTDVKKVLAAVVKMGARIAFASRTHDSQAARSLLEAHDLWIEIRGDERLFQAYPSSVSGGRCKSVHFTKIFHALSLGPEDALFFDDMQDNVDHAIKGGTASILLGHKGLTWDAFEKGVEEWHRTREAQS